MAEKTIWVLTHGERSYGPEYPNPGMTNQGCSDIIKLREYLPKTIGDVVCGTGLRFLQMARFLELSPNRYSTIIGTADAITEDKTGIVLANGTVVPLNQFTARKDMGKAYLALLHDLKNNSVICSGRPFMGDLGVKDAREGEMYRLVSNSLTGGFSIYRITPDGIVTYLGTFCEDNETD